MSVPGDQNGQSRQDAARAQMSAWDAGLYEKSFSFIWKYGQDLVELLAPKPGELILDLGSGTGQLSQTITERGARVIGLEHSDEMVEQARAQFPDIEFRLGDAANFEFAETFDAVFSNASIHWVRNREGLVQSVANALRPGGRFVAEFGGRGNVQLIIDAIMEASAAAGFPQKVDANPWYFPSIGQYSSLLERHGLYPTFAVLFERPTPLNEGEAGLSRWLDMFAGSFFLGMPSSAKTAVYRQVEEQLKPLMFRDGTWIADYRRLRFSAAKEDPANS